MGGAADGNARRNEGNATRRFEPERLIVVHALAAKLINAPDEAEAGGLDEVCSTRAG